MSGPHHAARDRRPRTVPKRTLTIRHILKRDNHAGRALYPEAVEGRPRTRGECCNGPRPCPYVACRYHLFLDVTPSGGITFNFPDLEPEQLANSCALDAAEQGGMRLEDIGALMNLVRERVRQIEVQALGRMSRDRRLGEVADGGTVGRRHLPMVP